MHAEHIDVNGKHSHVKVKKAGNRLVLGLKQAGAADTQQARCSAMLCRFVSQTVCAALYNHSTHSIQKAKVKVLELA